MDLLVNRRWYGRKVLTITTSDFRLIMFDIVDHSTLPNIHVQAQTFSHSTMLTSVSKDPFTCCVAYRLKKSQKWWYMFTTVINIQVK